MCAYVLSRTNYCCTVYGTGIGQLKVTAEGQFKELLTLVSHIAASIINKKNDIDIISPYVIKVLPVCTFQCFKTGERMTFLKNVI